MYVVFYGDGVLHHQKASHAFQLTSAYWPLEHAKVKLPIETCLFFNDFCHFISLVYLGL